MFISRYAMAFMFLGLLSNPVLAEESSSAPARDPNFVINIQSHSDDWAFALGPKGSPDMGMTLIRQDLKGSVAFSCSRKTGTRTLAVKFADLNTPLGAERHFHVVVGLDDREIDMVNQDTPEDKPSVFISEGPATSAILLRMSEVGENVLMYLKFYDTEGHSIQFPLTTPRDLAATANKICEGWHAAANPNEPHAGNVPKPLAPEQPRNAPPEGIIGEGLHKPN